jgi:hypothetical protein
MLQYPLSSQGKAAVTTLDSEEATTKRAMSMSFGGCMTAVALVLLLVLVQLFVLMFRC